MLTEVGAILQLLLAILKELLQVREEQRQAVLAGDVETDREAADARQRSGTEILAALDSPDFPADLQRALERVREAQRHSNAAARARPQPGKPEPGGAGPGPQIGD